MIFRAGNKFIKSPDTAPASPLPAQVAEVTGNTDATGTDAAGHRDQDIMNQRSSREGYYRTTNNTKISSFIRLEYKFSSYLNEYF